MDLYPKDFTERLEKEANEIKEFVECLKSKGVWNNNMKVYRDKNGNLIAEWVWNMSQELPKEPKFYPNEDSVTLSIANVNVCKLRIPSEQRVTYEANDEGIVKITETFDQDGEPLYGSNEMIIPKEVFVVAYKKYIEDDE